MRKVKLAAIQPRTDYDSALDFMKNINTTIDLIEQAGKAGCDLVTSCEDIAVISHLSLHPAHHKRFRSLVSESQPKIEGILSGLAKRYKMYIVGCYLNIRNGDVFNTAFVFDREGCIVGSYDKTHLPANEKTQTTAGSALSTFDLDFGRVGILICYDMMFPETLQTLALKGAEVILHPTFGYNWYDEIGEATIKVRANDNGVYIVTSKNYAYNGAGRSGIVDYWGHKVVDAGYKENTVVIAEIDLDIKKTQPSWYFNAAVSGVCDVTERLKRERRPALYNVLCDENNNPLPALTETEINRLLQRIDKGELGW